MIRTLSLLLVGLAWAGSAWAARPLTFREALVSAEEANPALARSGLDARQAGASLLSSRGIFDPALDVDGQWRQSRQEGFFQGFPFKSESRFWTMDSRLRHTLPTGTSWSVGGGLDRNFSLYLTELEEGIDSERVQDAYTASTSISVSQELLRGHRLAYNLHHVSRARDQLAIAELDQERMRQDTLAQTAQAYWSWAYQERLVDIAAQQEEIAEEALRVGILRLEAGEVAPVERTRLEAALVEARSNALDADLTANQAADTLLLLMGEAPGQAIEPATGLGEVPELELDVEAVVDVALQQNLDLAVARANLDIAGAERRYARHALLPSLSVTASAGRGSQQPDPSEAITGLFGPEAFPHIAIGGGLTVPLGNRSARGEAQRTTYAEEAVRLQVEELERGVRSEVEHQARQVTSAGRRVELADVQLRLAEETLAAEEALEEAGRAIQRDVLEARTRLFTARVEAAKARADYRQAQTELLRLQGQIDLALP